MQLHDWSFTGTFDNFNNPPLLKFFLSNLLFGRHGSKIAGKQDEKVDKIVEVACQFLIQNTRNDRQVKRQAKFGEFAEFLLKYLEQVESILNFISSMSIWQLGRIPVIIIENIIKYFFARDLLNYARLMPVHLAQMNALETEDPETWSALKSGGFVVTKSEIPFTLMFTDQALEQEIKKLKGQGGMVGLSRDEGALDRPCHYCTSSCSSSGSVPR